VPVRHEIDVDGRLIIVHIAGAVTGAEILGYYADLVADPLFRPGLAVLADCRAVTAVPTFAEIRIVATAQTQTPSVLRPRRAAVVVTTAWLFGIARQFGALAERTGVRVMPFYDEAEARGWLANEAAIASVGDDAPHDSSSEPNNCGVSASQSVASPPPLVR
jgi:hypothetical protein